LKQEARIRYSTAPHIFAFITRIPSILEQHGGITLASRESVVTGSAAINGHVYADNTLLASAREPNNQSNGEHSSKTYFFTVSESALPQMRACMGGIAKLCPDAWVAVRRSGTCRNGT
jgi:hypothetical protein